MFEKQKICKRCEGIQLRQQTMKILVLLAILPFVLGIDPEVKIEDTNPATTTAKGNVKLITINKNKDAYLTCVVHNKQQNRDVEWKLVTSTYSITISVGQASKDPFRFQVDQPSAISWRLKVQNVQVNSSEARYVCQVLIGDQKYAKDERTLKVVDPPQIIDIQTDSDKTVNEGDPLDLKCNATGVPFPKVKWERLAGGLLPSGGVEHADFVMNMGMATKEHRGAFKCTAQNEAGIDERIVIVNVRFYPRVQPMALSVNQAKGYRKDLLCNAEAFPIPSMHQFLWTKGGKPLTGSNYKVTFIEGAMDRVFTKLTIFNVQNEDYGFYKCLASNSEGDGSAEIELKPSDTPTPDLTGQIRSGAAFLSVSLTTLIMLVCVCLIQKF